MTRKKPLTRAQKLENGAFLRALRRTGNVREAARAIGKAYATMQHRRGRDAAFATLWDAALVSAQVRLRGRAQTIAVHKPHPNPSPGEQRPALFRSGRGPDRPGDPEGEGLYTPPLRTRGGEEVLVVLRSGKVQVRRAQPGKLTKACEQAFLAALSATANVKLSAAAAGAAEAAFYRRKRNDPGFAREWRLALQQGWESLDAALVAGTLVDAAVDDGWRHNDPPPIPPMTANQAIQLLHLHHKEARLWAERPDIHARYPGETTEQWSARRAPNYRAERARVTEDLAIAATLRAEPDERAPHEHPAPMLPALEQVTGWSRAKRHARGKAARETAPARTATGSPQSGALRGAPAGREANPSDVMGFAHDRPQSVDAQPEVDAVGFALPPAPDPANGEHHPDTALFGGWRLEDLTPEQRAKGAAALAEARRRPWNPGKVRAKRLPRR